MKTYIYYDQNGEYTGTIIVNSNTFKQTSKTSFIADNVMIELDEDIQSIGKKEW